MYAWGKNNKDWQQYKLENLSDSVGMVLSLYCLGILNKGHALTSMNDLYQYKIIG
jgi:hypothetical protein